MAAKKWVARVLWWRGKNVRPRKNQRVSNGLIRAKSLEELVTKLARTRKRAWELLESGGRQDPGGYFTRLIETRIQELYELKSRMKHDHQPS